MPKVPKIRYGGGIEILSKLLDCPVDPYSQDWTYENAQPERIAYYLDLYENYPLDENTKFSLMEMIIQAVNDQEMESEREKWWKEISLILGQDFNLHEYTIYYWSCFDSELEDSFAISKNMRELWLKAKA